jgi:hypothetical protein
MGHSISSQVHDKLEANRRNGRLCAGGRNHCTTPATVKVITTDDEAGRTYGPAKFCRRHNVYPVGYVFSDGLGGAGATVLRHEPIGPAAMFTVIGAL